MRAFSLRWLALGLLVAVAVPQQGLAEDVRPAPQAESPASPALAAPANDAPADDSAPVTAETPPAIAPADSAEAAAPQEPEPEKVAQPGPTAEPDAAEAEAAESPQEPATPVVAATPEPEPDLLPAAIETALAASDALGKADREALTAFYAGRDHAPLWIRDGKLDGAARAVVHRLANADTYGLDASRYVLPPLDIGLDGKAAPADLAAAEIGLTVAAVKFAGDAQAGIFDPATLGELMTARPVRPERKAILDGLGTAEDKVAYLEGFNPPQPGFAALRKLLADLRARDDSEALPEIPEGPSLKPGMSDGRVPALRARLGLPVVTDETEFVYDEATVEAVKAFQERASLDVDGVIGPQTRSALNGGSEVAIADVLVNMERWRWVPRDMGAHHVWVNIPEFRLRVVSGGKPFFETRVIVGTAKNQTPVFSDEIEYVDVNPYWNVPRSIAAKEMMPQIRQDPDFLARRGFEVIYTGGGRDMLIDPRSVDWSLWDGETMPFRFRQPPGGENALGRVKFMFPNKHAVYLHDTPTRNLFSRSVRAFSHGCVRVDNPVEFADALLAREEELNGQRIKHLIGGGANGSLPLKRHVPVHLTYFTVWVDEAGEAQKRPDLYGYDGRMKSAMGLGS